MSAESKKLRRTKISRTRPVEWLKHVDPITADFSYLLLLGDRKGIEQQTKTWDKTIVERSREMKESVNIVYKISARGTPIFAYANNHYCGYAPAIVRLFHGMWEHK